MASCDPTKPRVLIVDDDTEIRNSLAGLLDMSGYTVCTSCDGKTGLKALASEPFQFVLCDLRLPGLDGLAFIKECRTRCPDAAVILMTAFGSADVALEAMRSGARDYIAKPFSGEELLFTLRKVEEREKLKNENALLKNEILQRYTFSNIVAKSDSMKVVFETVKRLCNYNTTVLITGESGTGKELIARAIHENSPRKNKPFIAVNCGAIPETLMESELFGHKRGAFTDATRDKKGLFEEADGGTLFLDEIGELPLHLQVKLLRALQERTIMRVGDEVPIEIDVRIISATLRNLEDDAKQGRFRDDLLYRLNVVALALPPLRDRPEDIPVLVEHFMAKHTKRLGMPEKSVPPEFFEMLLQHGWKGNARELENCIERSLVLSSGDALEIDSLPEHVRSGSANHGGMLTGDLAVTDDNLSIKKHSRTLEITLIQRALKKTKGNRTHAAKILEISHRALLYKLKEYGITD